MYTRMKYIKKLKASNINFITIVTGVRRAGKTVILKQFISTLDKKKNNIIYISMEDYENEYLTNPDNFYNYVIANIKLNVKNYLFVDEIQMINNVEKVINSLHSKKITNIFITGSNSFMLSSGLSTLLSGRYIEIEVLPFSFLESKNYNSTSLENHLIDGGIPIFFGAGEIPKDIILDGLVNSIITKDIINYNNSINPDSLDRILNYYLDNIGNIENSKKVSNYMTSNDSKISDREVKKVTTALKNSFLFYECRRFDLRGKKILSHSSKFYVVDLSFRKKIHKSIKDLGRVIENAVFLNLKYLEYDAYIGKIGELEIDFVVEKNGEYKYIQVSQSILNETTYTRELRPLLLINDSFPKYLITMDKIDFKLENGINHLELEKFLIDGFYK